MQYIIMDGCRVCSFVVFWKVVGVQLLMAHTHARAHSHTHARAHAHARTHALWPERGLFNSVQFKIASSLQRGILTKTNCILLVYWMTWSHGMKENIFFILFTIDPFYSVNYAVIHYYCRIKRTIFRAEVGRFELSRRLATTYIINTAINWNTFLLQFL